MADQEVGTCASARAMETANISSDDVVPDESTLENRSTLAVFHDGINHCIDKCLDAKVFATCYKPIWEGNKDMFEALIQQVMSEAKDKVKEELENTFQSESLEGSLGLMDELMNESKLTNIEKVAWRPSGDPEADSRAYFMAIKKRKLQELESELQRTRHEEEMLTETVHGKRKELSVLAERLHLALRDEADVCEASRKFKEENASYFESITVKVNTETEYETDPENMMET